MPRLLRDLTGQRVFADGCVACIGAFDGLHRGHQALVGRAVERARALRLPALALGFEPLPREYFARLRGTLPPARLSTPRARIEGLWALGADTVALPRFDARLATLAAEDFIIDVLHARFGAREVWVGPGFRFGRDRRGDLAMLQSLGAVHGMQAVSIEPLALEGERVSSTRARAALAVGDFAAAAQLLGQRYRIGGRVIRGRQLGRQLGYPTANLRFPWTPPLSGIFAVRVHGIGAVARDGVASFGTRPTVGGTDTLLEAHLFDFDGDLYGQRIEVEFVRHLRAERRFDDLPALVAQMHHDAAAARLALAADGAVPAHAIPPMPLRQAHPP
jgi:riboflavin kinase/FMN adenylyltransferase